MSLSFMGGIVIFVAIALGGAVYITRKYTLRFPASLNLFLSQLLAGRPDLVTEISTNDDAGLGASASGRLNSFIKKIRDIIGNISSIGLNLTHISDKMQDDAQGMLRISETTSQQADQVATAMQEMSQTINDIAQSMNSAADSGQQMRDNAEITAVNISENVRSIGHVLVDIESWAETNRELAEATNGIYGIITVINDIADQTNLLALNAAIEAARAGEHGRGFAVVSEEVRKLADKTSKATKEIASLIEHVKTKAESSTEKMDFTLKKVNESIERAEGADSSLKDIVTSITHVADITQRIASTIEEQSKVSEDVLMNMQSVSEHSIETRDIVVRISDYGVSINSNALGLYSEICNVQKDELDQKMEDALKKWTGELTELLESAVKSGKLGDMALFDEQYRSVADNKSQTGASDFFGREVQSLLKRWAGINANIIYVVAMDRNGFMPTHPIAERAGITMSDPISLGGAKARSMMGQAFRRPKEAGGELAIDISLPLDISGKHWGCLRIGYKPSVK